MDESYTARWCGGAIAMHRGSAGRDSPVIDERTTSMPQIFRAFALKRILCSKFENAPSPLNCIGDVFVNSFVGGGGFGTQERFWMQPNLVSTAALGFWECTAQAPHWLR